MGATAHALAAFSAWYIVLTLLLVSYRTKYLLGGRAVNDFRPDGSDLDAMGSRVTRARDNCFETLPLFAALAVAASISGHTDVTDGLAMWVVYTRVLQSIMHILSTSVPAVLVRATLFTVQLVIYLIWTVRLLSM